MKWIKKCPVFLLLVISGILFTIAGIGGKNSIYKEYSFDIRTRPYLALVMEGVEKGRYPWEIPVYRQTVDAAYNTLYDGAGNAEAVIAKVMEGFERKTEGEDDASETSAGDLLRQKKVQENNTSTLIGELNDKIKGQESKNEEIDGAVKVPDGQEEAGNEIIPEEKTVYHFTEVTEDYFNDAVFIGDSRTVGMFEYGGIEERADFLAKISLTIYDVFTAPIGKDEETGKKITVEEALTQKQYGKVYLMLGINELGTGTTQTFMKEYENVVERLQQLQPDAIIFVEGIMRVTAPKDEKDTIFNNKNINGRNSEIAKLADNKRIFYIDVNEAVCDESGSLNEAYTADEVHLKAQYYKLWKQFLLEHGIRYD